MERPRAASKRKTTSDEEDEVEGDDDVAKRSRADSSKTVEITPSTEFATKILPRAITEITALAELVDNAIEATNNNDGERSVHITFSKDNKTLVIDDNGCGMDEDRVVECFSLGHSERSAANIEAARKTSHLDFDARSSFSRHGVGAKTAIFKLGRRADILTRTAKASEATRLIIDLDKIEHHKTWTAEKSSGKRAYPGTTITIRDLSPEACDAFKGHDVAQYLAQLYYFHIAGIPPILNALKEDGPPQKLTVITFNNNSLAREPTRFFKVMEEAKKDHVQQISFRVPLLYHNPDKKTARVEDQIAIMHVFLFYFPSIRGTETKPTATVDSPLLDNTDDLFWFWQGRYLAEIHTTLPLLQRGFWANTPGMPAQIYDRVMGVVVLPSIMTTSDYKTNIWSEDRLWKKAFKAETYNSVEYGGRELSKETLKARVRDWLKICHQYDEETGFSEPVGSDDGIVKYKKISFHLPGARKKGERIEKTTLASDGHFRYKAGSGATRVRVGKVIYFWRNEGENTKVPTGDLVTFYEIFHKESEEVQTIPVAEITEVITARQVQNHQKEMMPKAVAKHSDPSYIKSYPFPSEVLKADTKYDFGVQIIRANGEVFKPLRGESLSIELAISGDPIPPWSCSSQQARSNMFSVTLRQRGKFKFTFRVKEPDNFARTIEPLVVDLAVLLGDMKYLSAEYLTGHTSHVVPFKQPISVRLLKADSSDLLCGWESLEPITVEIYRSSKQSQPIYTLPLQDLRLEKDAGSMVYAIGNFTLNRVGPNEEELGGSETIYLGFNSGPLVTRPTARLNLTLASGAVGSIRFEPELPVPELLRYKEALPICKVTLLDKDGELVCRPQKKTPALKLKANGLKMTGSSSIVVDEHGQAELPQMTVQAYWGATGSLTVSVHDPSFTTENISRQFTFSVPLRQVSLRHVDLEAGNTFNITAGKSIKDINVQIEDEKSKIDSEYDGELSLVFPDKEQRINIPISGGRGAIKELKPVTGGRCTFRLASAEKEEAEGLATIITVNVAPGKAEKCSLRVLVNQKDAIRLQVGQKFTLVVSATDALDNVVPFTEETWRALQKNLRLEVGNTDEGEADTSEIVLGSSALEEGVAHISDLQLLQSAGNKELTLTDKSRPPLFSPAKVRLTLTVGPPEKLFILPALVEMQTGTEVELTLEVQDVAGNVINHAQGSVTGESRGFQEFLLTAKTESGPKKKPHLASTWHLRAAHTPREEPYTGKITATLTAPIKTVITAELPVVIRPNLKPHSIEIIESGRLTDLAAGSRLHRLKAIVRRQDRSPFVQAGMRALAQLNGQRFHGTVDDETVTFHDITLPGIVGVHQMQIELQGADGKILLVSAHQIDVVPGPPEKLVLLSGLKAVDIKNPVLPPLVFSVQDTVDNALPGPFTLEITAVAEAQSSGTLPTLLNAPVRKKIGHTSKDWSLRLTPGVTSQISLQVTLVEHPSVTLTTPTFSFQGDVQVAPERQQHINILNELRQLNLELDTLQSRRRQFGASQNERALPPGRQRELDDVQRKLLLLERSVPKFDKAREKPQGLPSLSLELQPSELTGIVGLSVTLGKVADPQLAALLTSYSGERLKVLVVKDTQAFQRLRSSIGEQQALVLGQIDHRMAPPDCVSEEGFIKFSYNPHQLRYNPERNGDIFPSEEGMQFLVNTIQCTPKMRRELWYYVYRDALLFDSYKRMDDYLARNKRAAQNMLAITGEACVDAVHRKFKPANGGTRFACPLESERRSSSSAPLSPEFVYCLPIGKEYRALMKECNKLQTEVANTAGQQADMERNAEELRTLDTQIAQLSARIQELRKHVKK